MPRRQPIIARSPSAQSWAYFMFCATIWFQAIDLPQRMSVIHAKALRLLVLAVLAVPSLADHSQEADSGPTRAQKWVTGTGAADLHRGFGSDWWGDLQCRDYRIEDCTTRSTVAPSKSCGASTCRQGGADGGVGGGRRGARLAAACERQYAGGAEPRGGRAQAPTTRQF